MEEILIQQNPHWNNTPYQNLFFRGVFSRIRKQLSLKEIQIFLGLRRAGKSTLMRLTVNQLMQTIDPKTILYLNLDDPYFSDIWKDAKQLYTVLSLAEKLTGQPIHILMLDEIQNILGWEKFVKSVYDSERFQKIIITGSNSSLLAGEYASLLSGRYVTTHVTPLSFAEILTMAGIDHPLTLTQQKSKVLSLLDHHMQHGAFPEIIKIQDDTLKRDVLQGYYDSILLKDCIEQHTIRNTHYFKTLSLHLFANVGACCSYLSLAKALGSNENTMKDFVSYLENGFLFHQLRQFHFSSKIAKGHKKKIYAMDNGLITATTQLFSKNLGKLFENMVYTELVKQHCGNIAFHHEHKECDFVIQKDNTLIAIQSCYVLNEQNRKREIEGLEDAMQKYGIKRGVIVTYDQEEVIDKEKQIAPFWKYFCGINDEK